MAGRNNRSSRNPYTEISRQNEENVDSSLVSKKSVAFIFTAVLAFGGTAAHWFESKTMKSDIGGVGNQLANDIDRRSQEIANKRKLIKNEQAILSAFIEDMGLLNFQPSGAKTQYSVGLSTVTREWSDYLSLCEMVNGTLATPIDTTQFSLISSLVYDHGPCFIGASRQDDGNNWKTPDNVKVSLSKFFDPAKSPPKDFLCAYILNTGNAFLYAASCGGNHPGINCFVCSRTVK